jgi:hypothetical protein
MSVHIRLYQITHARNSNISTHLDAENLEGVGQSFDCPTYLAIDEACGAEPYLNVVASLSSFPPSFPPSSYTIKNFTLNVQISHV